jgi:hypothetical protein
LAERVEKAICAHLAYSSRFWADHLRATAFSLELLFKVKAFIRARFLYWLEVLSLVKDVSIATQTLRTIVEWCGVSSSKQRNKVVLLRTHGDGTVAFVKDAIKPVNVFGSVISQSVPHIYALPFAPATSEVVRQFSPYFPHSLNRKGPCLVSHPICLTRRCCELRRIFSVWRAHRVRVLGQDNPGLGCRDRGCSLGSISWAFRCSQVCRILSRWQAHRGSSVIPLPNHSDILTRKSNFTSVPSDSVPFVYT